MHTVYVITSRTVVQHSLLAVLITVLYYSLNK